MRKHQAKPNRDPFFKIMADNHQNFKVVSVNASLWSCSTLKEAERMSNRMGYVTLD